MAVAFLTNIFSGWVCCKGDFDFKWLKSCRDCRPRDVMRRLLAGKLEVISDHLRLWRCGVRVSMLGKTWICLMQRQTIFINHFRIYEKSIERFTVSNAVDRSRKIRMATAWFSIIFRPHAAMSTTFSYIVRVCSFSICHYWLQCRIKSKQ